MEMASKRLLVEREKEKVKIEEERAFIECYRRREVHRNLKETRLKEKWYHCR